MNRELEARLIEGLDALEAGDSVEEILARYPAGEAELLRPQLETAVAISQARPTPSRAAQTSSKKAFLQEAARLREGSSPPQASVHLFRRFFTAFAAVALLLVVGAAGLALSAHDAIPGDRLYDVKRTVEDVRLFFAFDPAAREALVEQFEEERTLEAYEMLETGREGEVEYYGVVASKTPTQWEVGHLTMFLTDETVFVGEPQVGDRVHAICNIRGGRAFARRVQVVADNVVPVPPAPTGEENGAAAPPEDGISRAPAGGDTTRPALVFHLKNPHPFSTKNCS